MSRKRSSIPTNDSFVSLMGVRLPAHGSVIYEAPANDAGTEENDQSGRSIPGPRCGGEVLTPFLYDWRNPVARVVVTRTH